MDKRKLPVILLAAALLSFAAVSKGLGCKRHYRRVAVHHCRMVKRTRLVAVCHRHYRVYRSATIEPKLVSFNVEPWPSPQPAVIPSAEPAKPWPAVAIAPATLYERVPPATTCCCPPPTCCSSH
jgi:hypothetical protein